MSHEKSMVRREESTPEHVNQAQFVVPRVDIYENNDELLMIADVPGVNQDDISVQLNKNELILEAHRSGDVEGNLTTTEFHLHGYRRSFLVPQGLDAEKINAEMKNGVLRIHLPKSEALKPRQIEIQAG